jgi:hypothetical protein
MPSANSVSAYSPTIVLAPDPQRVDDTASACSRLELASTKGMAIPWNE